MFMQHSNKKQLSSSTRKKSPTTPTTLTIASIFAIVMSLSILSQSDSYPQHMHYHITLTE